MEPPRAARTPRTRSSGLPYCRRNSARSRPFALGYLMEPPNVWTTVDVKEHNVGGLGFPPPVFGRRVIAPNRRPPTTAMSKNCTHCHRSIRRIIQPRDPFLRGPRAKVVVRPTQSCEEIDGHSLPVSALIYACMLELIASRMQLVISTTS